MSEEYEFVLDYVPAEKVDGVFVRHDVIELIRLVDPPEPESLIPRLITILVNLPILQIWNNSALSDDSEYFIIRLFGMFGVNIRRRNPKYYFNFEWRLLNIALYVSTELRKLVDIDLQRFVLSICSASAGLAGDGCLRGLYPKEYLTDVFKTYPILNDIFKGETVEIYYAQVKRFQYSRWIPEFITNRFATVQTTVICSAGSRIFTFPIAPDVLKKNEKGVWVPAASTKLIELLGAYLTSESQTM